MKVFVYGTLKSGYGNNRLLSNATCLGEAWTNENYMMIGAGFPVLMELPESQGMIVKGEVYEFDSEQILENLDMLEGEGAMYNRHEINVRLANGDNDRAYIYIGHPQYWGRRITNEQDTRFINASGELEWPGTR